MTGGGNAANVGQSRNDDVSAAPSVWIFSEFLRQYIQPVLANNNGT